MNNPVLNKLFIFVLIIALIFITLQVGIALIGLMMPFLIGLFLAFISNPIVTFLDEKVKIPRSIASFLGILFMLAIAFAVIFLLGSILKSQFPVITNTIEGLTDSLEHGIENLFYTIQGRFPKLIKGTFQEFKADMPNVSQILFGSGSNIGTKLVSFAKGIPSALIFVIVTFLSAYFISIEYERISTKLREMIRNNELVHRVAVGFKGGAKKGIGSWFKAQLIIMSITAVLGTIVFYFMGYRFAILFAIILAIFDALPIFGSGAILWPLFAYYLIYGNYTNAILAIGLYITIVASRQFVEPKLIGKQIGINPLVTLLTIYIGFKLMGLIGMILGIILLVFVTGIIRTKET